MSPKYQSSAAQRELPCPEITLEQVQKLRDGTQRVCFLGNEDKYLVRSTKSGFVGRFKVPFVETIKPIFDFETGFSLGPDKYGKFWVSIRDEQQFERIRAWMEQNRELVFIRSTLSLTIAMSMHQTRDSDASLWRRTPIGDLENRAKYGYDLEACEKLADLLVDLRHRLPFYCENRNTVVCAIPPRPDKGFDLPSWLAAEVSARDGIQDITASLQWKGTKPELKHLPVQDKWATLEHVGLEVGVDLRGKNVILIDDLYQSGTTMQFVAQRLQQAGARCVLGLSLVKSLTNSDNQ